MSEPKCRFLTIRSYPTGPRVWIFGQRLHHGATGCILIATRRRTLVVLGLVLCAHDRRDWRRWFARERIAGAYLDAELST